MAKKMTHLISAALILVALLAGAVTVYAFSLGKWEKVKATGGVVTIPQKEAADGKAHYYRLVDGGKNIDFIVVKASDGSFRTAFDACEACFEAKKGYEQKGNMLVCKNCNMKFAIDRLGPSATGGCNPSYLPSTSDGKNIIIKATDLQAGGKYF